MIRTIPPSSSDTHLARSPRAVGGVLPGELIAQEFGVRIPDDTAPPLHGSRAAHRTQATSSQTKTLTRLVDSTATVSHLERRLRDLEQERDALADEVGQTFEELYCLRLLSSELSSGDLTADLPTLAEEVLPNLCDLIRAEGLALAPDELQAGTTNSTRIGHTTANRVVWTGNTRIQTRELLQLIAQLSRRRTIEPVVFNRDSRHGPASVTTSVRNLAAVPLWHQHRRYGWLIAVNRRPPAGPTTHAPCDLQSRQFGTRDAGLLSTAATMLAGHARNSELFRAEEDLRVGVIEAITGALDARDPYTCGHSRRVGRFAAEIARRLGLPPDRCEQLYVTGLLHDVGKIGVPDNVLKKPGRLTSEEFDRIKQHPVIGHAILSPLTPLRHVLPGVLHHHERIDGKGYPHALAGEDIPHDARILAVADGYDAMTSNRAYRNAMPRQKALEILKSGAGEQWDAEAVTAFVEVQTAG